MGLPKLSAAHLEEAITDAERAAPMNDAAPPVQERVTELVEWLHEKDSSAKPPAAALLAVSEWLRTINEPAASVLYVAAHATIQGMRAMWVHDDLVLLLPNPFSGVQGWAVSWRTSTEQEGAEAATPAGDDSPLAQGWKFLRSIRG